MLKRLLLTSLLLALLTGCIPGPRAFADERWQYADLRLIDPVDASDPQFDLIAAYARCSGSTLDVRLDLLESVDPWAYDLYLAIDDRPGGRRDLPLGGESELVWDLWIALPAGQPVATRRADDSAATARAWQNTRLDTVQVQVPAQPGCRSNTRVQAYLTPPGRNQIADQTDSFTLGGLPPKQAEVLLAFTDVLPGITPAQALRRWNGAHTGPYGQRHGLAVLLEAVDWAKVPVILLDLNQAASLSALDAVGGTSLVRDLTRQGLISLPEVDFSPFVEIAVHQQNQSAARNAGLPFSTLSFDRSNFHLGGKALRFFAGEDRITSTGERWAAAPSDNETPFRQADEGGLVLPVKLALLEAAQMPNISHPIILGGSLPESEWADAEIALPALEYITAHPWIRPLYDHDWVGWSAGRKMELPNPIRDTSWLCANHGAIHGFDAFGNPLPQFAVQQRDLLAAQLAALPNTPFTEQAWQAWNVLTAPGADCALAALQANYLSEIGYLIAAAHWAQKPDTQANCAADLDFDGQYECLLSNAYVFAVLELDGGRLAFAALRTESGAFQIAGGQSQLGVGLADPLAWRLERGPRADPYVLAGAFDDAEPPDQPYDWQTTSSGISLTHPKTGRQKIYELHDEGLRVTIVGSPGQKIQVPLVVAPQERFDLDWPVRYFARQSKTVNTLHWGAGNDQRVEARVEGATFRLDTFLDSVSAIRRFEDPNYEYPDGHYLPFPTALLTLQAEAPEIVVTFRPFIFP